MKDDKKWQGRRVKKEMSNFGAKEFKDEGGKRDGPLIIWLHVFFFNQ